MNRRNLSEKWWKRDDDQIEMKWRKQGKKFCTCSLGPLNSLHDVEHHHCYYGKISCCYWCASLCCFFQFITTLDATGKEKIESISIDLSLIIGFLPLIVILFYIFVFTCWGHLKVCCYFCQIYSVSTTIFSSISMHHLFVMFVCANCHGVK